MSINAKSLSYIYIKYIGFGWVRFFGIPTIVGHLKPNPFHIYVILNIYDLVGLGFMTIVRHLMPYLFYTYILNIYDLVWFGFMAYRPL